MKCKIIYNPTMARQLLHMGNTIVDIKPHKVNKRETMFVFECTNKLLKDLTTITR